jgi:hypothetical protein
MAMARRSVECGFGEISHAFFVFVPFLMLNSGVVPNMYRFWFSMLASTKRFSDDSSQPPFWSSENRHCGGIKAPSSF